MTTQTTAGRIESVTKKLFVVLLLNENARAAMKPRIRENPTQIRKSFIPIVNAPGESNNPLNKLDIAEILL